MKSDLSKGEGEQLKELRDRVVAVCRTVERYCDSTSRSALQRFIESLCQEIQVFQVGVLGEFSTGKSTFLNALIGEKVLPARSRPCTAVRLELRHGDSRRAVVHKTNGESESFDGDEFSRYEDYVVIASDGASQPSQQVVKVELALPELEFLGREAALIDTPGINDNDAYDKQIEQLVNDEIDAIIFLTKAIQPLTKKERERLDSLDHALEKRYGTNDRDRPAIFLVVTWIDQVDESEDSLKDIKESAIDRAGDLGKQLDRDRRLFLLSPREALRGNAVYKPEFELFKERISSLLKDYREPLIVQRNREIILSNIDVALEELNKSQIIKLKHEVEELTFLISQDKAWIRDRQNELKNRINGSYEIWLSGLKKRVKKARKKWNSDRWWTDFVKDMVAECEKSITKDLVQWIQGEVTSIFTRMGEEINNRGHARQDRLARYFKTKNFTIQSQYDLGRLNVEEDGQWAGGAMLGAAVGVGLLGAGAIIPIVAIPGIIATVLGSLGVAAGVGGAGILGINVRGVVKERVAEQGVKAAKKSLDARIKPEIDASISKRFDTFIAVLDREVDRAICDYRNRAGELKAIEAAIAELKQIRTEVLLVGHDRDSYPTPAARPATAITSAHIHDVWCSKSGGS